MNLHSIKIEENLGVSREKIATKGFIALTGSLGIEDYQKKSCDESTHGKVVYLTIFKMAAFGIAQYMICVHITACICIKVMKMHCTYLSTL